MKKIPTLFIREFEGRKIKSISDAVTPGMEWVLAGEGLATVKIDGACCAMIGGAFYKRYDAKRGKTPPAGAIPCCDPDPVTGHWPHWVKVNPDDPADRWFVAAFLNTPLNIIENGDRTFEAIGPHFQANPYGLEADILVPHGEDVVEVERTFDGIRAYLEKHNIEGLVFWRDGEPQCKIKRSDFGFAWPSPSLAALNFGQMIGDELRRGIEECLNKEDDGK